MLLARQIEDRCRFTALRRIVAESIARQEGVPLAKAERAVRKREAELHSQFMLELEATNPGLAARMDLRSIEDMPEEKPVDD